MTREVVAVQVGRKRYRVRYRTLTNLYGKMHYGHARIDVDDGQSASETCDTLLHEILHALWARYKLADRCREERAVTALARGLTAVFRDNPGLCPHLESLIKEAR